MRTITTNQGAILDGTARKTRARIKVADAGATLRALDSYALGVNLIKAVRWGQGIDDPGEKWSVDLVREVELLSLAPLMATSGANRQFNIDTAYAALLQVGRAMRIEWALNAEDDPAIPSWNLAFSGYIDVVSWGSNTLTISGRDDAALLIDTYIERERVYAFAQGANADRGCYVFEPSQTYAVGDRVIPTSPNSNAHFYRVTSITTGIAASTEPTWPTGGGSTVTSGGVTFTESGATSKTTGTALETVIQQVLDDNLGIGTVTLWCPVSPSFAVKSFLITKQGLFEELRLLADSIGWCIRYMYDSGSGTMKLKLYDPLRSSTTSLRTFAVTKVEAIRRAEIQVFDIRNVIEVIYSDSQDLDASGFPKRKLVRVTDSASVTKYRRRWASVAESSTSNIDTSTEATNLANAILSDLAEPSAELTATVPLFPFAELPDLYTLAANGVHFDSNQKLAMVRYDHVHSAAESSTTFTLRGKPASGKTKWKQRLTDSYGAEQHQFTALENFAPMTITVDSKPVGGARISFDWTAPRGSKETQFELHLSTTIAFTPSSATLVATGKERFFEVGNLDPAKPHYAKVIAVTWNAGQPVRSGASAEVSFTPGRAAATHANPEVYWGRRPLNGSFETQLDPAGPPDFWTAGSWGTRELLMTDANGVSGRNYVKLVTTDAITAAHITSAIFPIAYSADEAPVEYIQAVTFWAKRKAGSGNNLQIQISYYDQALERTGSPTTTSYDLATDVDKWKKLAGAINPPAGARFAQVKILVQLGASGREVHIDSIESRDATKSDFEVSHSRATTNAGASYSNGATVVFEDEVYDELSEYAVGTGIFTAQAAGHYLVTALVTSDELGWDLYEFFQAVLEKNGTAVAYGTRPFAPATDNWFLVTSLSTVVQLAAGDTLEISLSHDFGSAVALYADGNANYFTVDRIDRA